MPKLNSTLPIFRCVFSATTLLCPDLVTPADILLTVDVNAPEITAAIPGAWLSLARNGNRKNDPMTLTRVQLTRVVSLNGKPQVRVLPGAPAVRMCRSCGCTEDDCTQCINRTGEPCSWAAKDLCSACA